MVSNLSVIQCCNLIDILALNQAYSLWEAVQQDQMNPSISTVVSQGTKQVQMETSHPQVQLPQQQIGDVRFRSDSLLTSTGPVILSRTLAPSTSHTSVASCSHTPQSTTVDTPMTTVQYSQQQQLLCDNSTITTSSLSTQVHTHMV